MDSNKGIEMQVQILNNELSSGTRYITAACGKTVAEICIAQEAVYVVCKNASHAAWGGMGRRFESLVAAQAAYKSTAMRSIIQCAIAL